MFGTLVIPNGTALSNALDLGGGNSLLGLLIPPAWTAADITFQSDFNSDNTWNDIYTEGGTALSIASANVVADRYLLLDATTFAKLAGKIRLRSGTLALPVNQAAERTIGVALGKRWI